MYNDWIKIGDFVIHGYGIMIGLAFLTAVIVSMYRAKKLGLKQDAILDLALWAVLSGFLGAKLLYVIVEWKHFVKDPMAVLGSEGFVVYGGIVVGVTVGILYCKWKKLVVMDYFNMVMPQIALAQGIGRLGCFFAGCCYGGKTDSPLGIVFPAGSIAPSGVKLWPTQLIMSAGDILIAVVLYVLGRNKKISEHVGALYLVLYGVGRFLIEFLRNDVRGSVGALSTSQFISIFIVLAGVGLLFRKKINFKKEKKAE